jgi:hypothetical protein
MDIDGEISMNIFETRRAYVITFGAYLASLLLMIRAFEKQSTLAGAAVKHPSIIKIVVGLFCSIFFISLFKRSGNVLERIVLIFSSLFFLLWALETFSGYGYGWAAIPDNLTASLAVCGVATAIVGVRTVQMAYDKNYRPK